MKIAKLFSHSACGQSFEKLQRETGRIMKSNLSQLDSFTRQELPTIISNQRASIDALEQLSRQAKAALGKIK